MVSKVFGIYDSKAERFLPTIVRNTKGQVLREFIDLSKNKDLEIGKHPADFTLFELGQFDDSTGQYEMLEAKIPLGTALEWSTKES